jgi:hypothetical protein
LCVGACCVSTHRALIDNKTATNKTLLEGAVAVI